MIWEIIASISAALSIFVAVATYLFDRKTKKKADTIHAIDHVLDSYYKYKDDIFPFREHTRGRTVTFVMQMDDVPGLLSEVLKKVADFKANILTIQQAVPADRIALVTLSIEVREGEVTELFRQIQELEGVHYLKVLARQ